MKNWSSKVKYILDTLYYSDPEEEHPQVQEAKKIMAAIEKRLVTAEAEAAATRHARKVLHDTLQWAEQNYVQMCDGFTPGRIIKLRTAIKKIDAAKGHSNGL